MYVYPSLSISLSTRSSKEPEEEDSDDELEKKLLAEIQQRREQRASTRLAGPIVITPSTSTPANTSDSNPQEK